MCQAMSSSPVCSATERPSPSTIAISRALRRGSGGRSVSIIATASGALPDISSRMHWRALDIAPSSSNSHTSDVSSRHARQAAATSEKAAFRSTGSGTPPMAQGRTIEVPRRPPYRAASHATRLRTGCACRSFGSSTMGTVRRPGAPSPSWRIQRSPPATAHSQRFAPSEAAARLSVWASVSRRSSPRRSISSLPCQRRSSLAWCPVTHPCKSGSGDPSTPETTMWPSTPIEATPPKAASTMG